MLQILCIDLQILYIAVYEGIVSVCICFQIRSNMNTHKSDKDQISVFTKNKLG